MCFRYLLLLFSTCFVLVGICGARSCQYVKGSHFGSTITVDKRGKGKFRTVQDAIDAVPSNNNHWVKIEIAAGEYREQVTIPYDKPCIYLKGHGRSRTVITYDAHERTDTSATFTSFPSNIVARGITFMNSYNVFETFSWRKNMTDPASNDITQAVAARIYGDKSAFYECGFVGIQDTLWDAVGRHYFRSCYISGAVDFIFGYGKSFYEDCTINATFGRLRPFISDSTIYITAQGRSSLSDPGGFVFKKCVIYGNDNIYLGRAYGPYSRVIFYRTKMPSSVVPQGWDAWRYKGQENKFTFAEVGCKGRGSYQKHRVPWLKKLSAQQLHWFSRSAFIDKERWIRRLPLWR